MNHQCKRVFLETATLLNFDFFPAHLSSKQKLNHEVFAFVFFSPLSVAFHFIDSRVKALYTFYIGGKRNTALHNVVFVHVMLLERLKMD